MNRIVAQYNTYTIVTVEEEEEEEEAEMTKLPSNSSNM